MNEAPHASAVLPIAALIVLILVNTISRPSFLSITVRDGQLYGSLIDILRNSAPLMLVALGMTIVIATRGIDLSVGALMAVSGAVALTIIDGSADPESPTPSLLAITRRRARRPSCSARGTDSWSRCSASNRSSRPSCSCSPGAASRCSSPAASSRPSPAPRTEFMAQGYLLGLPFAFYVSVVAIAIVALIERRTALGVLTEAVGINPEASRLAGVRSRGIIWGAYAASGLLAGFAGILYSSNIMAADANAAGQYIELDAILAVVLGGTSLMGGKFSIAGTVDRRLHDPDPEVDDHLPRRAAGGEPAVPRARRRHRRAGAVAARPRLGDAARTILAPKNPPARSDDGGGLMTEHPDDRAPRATPAARSSGFRAGTPRGSRSSPPSRSSSRCWSARRPTSATSSRRACSRRCCSTTPTC